MILITSIGYICCGIESFPRINLPAKKNKNQNFQAMKILNEYKKLYPTILLYIIRINISCFDLHT